MKLLIQLAASSVLFCNVAVASSYLADVKVSGKIASSRCEVIAPNNGLYDLGRIKTLDKVSGPVALPPVTRTWRVKCDHPTTLSVIPEDNRVTAARGIGNTHFTFGNDGETSLGYFKLGISRAQIDNRQVMLKTAGQSISNGASTPLLPGIRTQWITKDEIVQAGNVFDVDITVFPWLNPRAKMVKNQLKVDGSVTLNFVFGL